MWKKYLHVSDVIPILLGPSWPVPRDAFHWGVSSPEDNRFSGRAQKAECRHQGQKLKFGPAIYILGSRCGRKQCVPLNIGKQLFLLLQLQIYKKKQRGKHVVWFWLLLIYLLLLLILFNILFTSLASTRKGDRPRSCQSEKVFEWIWSALVWVFKKTTVSKYDLIFFLLLLSWENTQ